MKWLLVKQRHRMPNDRAHAAGRRLQAQVVRNPVGAKAYCLNHMCTLGPVKSMKMLRGRAGAGGGSGGASGGGHCRGAGARRRAPASGRRRQRRARVWLRVWIQGTRQAQPWQGARGQGHGALLCCCQWGRWLRGKAKGCGQLSAYAGHAAQHVILLPDIARVLLLQVAKRSRVCMLSFPGEQDYHAAIRMTWGSVMSVT